MVTIVGAGIAGLTAAYETLKKGITPNLIYDSIGGRIHTEEIKINGQTFYHDMGAEYFLSSDIDMVNLVNELGINKKEYLSQRAIYDFSSSRHVILPSSEDNLLTGIKKKIQSLKYLGIKNMVSAKRLMDKLPLYHETIKELYDILASASLDSYYAKFKTKFDHLLSQTLEEFLKEEENLSDEFISKFVDPLFHPIYMLSSNKLNALYGILGFASKYDTIYHARNGNSTILSSLINNIENKTNMIQAKVIEIEKKSNSYNITLDDGEEVTTEYLFLAIPLKALKTINFTNFPENQFEKLNQLRNIKYNNSVYHHLIRGSPHKHISKIFDHGVSTIFVANTNNIVEINNVHYNQGNGIFDITSSKNFDNTDFQSFFDFHESIKSIHWDPSYPLYTPDTMNELPLSNMISKTFYCGTDSFISSMGTSVSTSKLVINSFSKLIRS